MAGQKHVWASSDRPNCVLWQFISSVGVLQPQEIIQNELSRSKTNLIKGLTIYQTQSSPSGDRLKAEKKLDGPQLEFVQKLARFLDLDEVQSYDLFCSYLAYEYRSSKKTLQRVLSSDRHCQALVLRVRDFYFMERIFLLRCLKQILSFWPPESQHPYREVYTTFVEEIMKDDQLLKSLLDQYIAVCSCSLPMWETHGTLMTERQALIWTHQNLREQCELLELLLIYYKDFEPDPEKYIEIVESFKRQGFGRHQTYKHIMDDSSEKLVTRIGFLQMLILLEGMDFELVQRCATDAIFLDHPLLKDQKIYQKLDRLFSSFAGVSSVQGPLLLAWTIVRHMYLADDDSVMTRKLGNQALQLSCFQTLSLVLSTEPFSGTSVVASLAHYLVYTLVYLVLSVYHEDTLGEHEELYGLGEKVLKQEFVAEHFWGKGRQEGFGNLYQSSLNKFPLEFSPLICLSTSLAAGSPESAKRVLDQWKCLPVYAEYLDKNSSQDIQRTRDNMVWILAKDKQPYSTGSLIIPSGTKGVLFPQDSGSPVIQWQCSINGWQLLLCELQEILHTVSHGAGQVSPSQLSHITDIVKLVKTTLTSLPAVIAQFEDITKLLYQVIHRFSSFSNPPLGLIACCVNCLTCVAKTHSSQVWHGISQTGLLPFLTENLANMTEVLSGDGLHSGQYGAILAAHECSQGHYPVTEALLEFFTQMVKPLHDAKRSNQLLPSALFFLREVLPAFHKWRYYSRTGRENLGQKCLGLFHSILNFPMLSSAKPDPKKPSLQEICVYSLLYTEASQALLEIISTGTDVVEVALAQQESSYEGNGVELIHLIQMAFSVLNRLLLLKPADSAVSPVERALSSQPTGRQHQHVIGIIAQYIYHRHNPRLPTIAILLLKRLAVVSPMSILACLGNDAEPVRDMFLLRLQAIAEDIRLKVAILELLSVSVDMQPGLIEMFLNVKPAVSSSSSGATNKASQVQDLSIGKVSCLQTLLDLMEIRKQLTYQCPPLLLCACVQFVESLWAGVRETAMAVLRSKESFWPSLMAPLQTDIGDMGNEDAEVKSCEMKACACVMKTLAQEFYIVPSSMLDKNLQKVLKIFHSQQRLRYWSKCISNCLEDYSSSGSTIDVSEDPRLLLLGAWKNLLLAATLCKVEAFQVDDDTRETILSDLLSIVFNQFSSALSVIKVKAASISSILFFMLVKQWKTSLKSPCGLLKDIEKTLLQTCTSTDKLMPSIQIGLIGALSLILQQIKDANQELDHSQLTCLVTVVCPLIQQSTLELPSPDTKATSPSEVKAQSNNMSVRLKLQVVCLSMLRDLLDATPWSQADVICILKQHSVVPSLLASIKFWIQTKHGVQYAQTAMLLFLQIAVAEKGDEHIANSGLTESVCLPLMKTYTGDTAAAVVTSGATVHITNRLTLSKEPSWQSVYGLSLDLYTILLRRLRYSFLQDAFDFVGVHQDQLSQTLELCQMVLSENIWTETRKVCLFLFQLSHFQREWRFQLPDVRNKLITGVCSMCQTLISLLIRPRYLQHVLERQSGKGCSRKNLSTSPLSTPLQTQTSTEDPDQPSAQLHKTQNSLFEILSICLSTLRLYTPGLCEILLDQSLDVSEYEPVLSLGFSSPAMEQDTPISFGSLLSVVTFCVRMLGKVDKTASPHKSSSGTITASVSPVDTTIIVPKGKLLYTMDNALYVMLSQAVRYLREPNLNARDKQLLKRELSTELNFFLSSYYRYLKRGAGPPSPCTSSTQLTSPQAGTSTANTLTGAQTLATRSGHSLSRTLSSPCFTTSQEQGFCKLVQQFVNKVLK